MPACSTFCPSTVVDIGCGHGKYALALAQHGAGVTGVDFALPLLARAQRLGAELGVRAHWLRGDMRRLPLRSDCFGAAILMDAFGFFDAEDENDEVPREAARVLVADGRLAMKVVNGGPILDAFRATDREERDGSIMTISRTLSLAPPRMIERIKVTGSRGHGTYERRQRLYRVDDVLAALVRTGFSLVGLFASPNGAAFEPTSSPAIWVIAQRRGAI